MDHLACFVPGMLALGAHAGAVEGEKANKYMQLARELTDTCWHMYSSQPTGTVIDGSERLSVHSAGVFHVQRQNGKLYGDLACVVLMHAGSCQSGNRHVLLRS